MWPVLERLIRNIRAGYVDLRLFLTGKADPELPPLRLRAVGGGDFRSLGKHLFDLTGRFGSLQQSSRILDIGCGSGRLALPLAEFLTVGQYEGFDVSSPAIRWCRKHISRKHPNFRFIHVALRNSDYSAVGRKAAKFVFPYPDSHFNCVVAYSVFTHLTFEEASNYLHQTYRVVMEGGSFVSTYFLVNRDSETAQSERFPYPRGPIRLASNSNPAFAVAIDEQVLVALMRNIGFSDVTVYRGSWYGMEGTTFQDLVVCTK